MSLKWANSLWIFDIQRQTLPQCWLKNEYYIWIWVSLQADSSDFAAAVDRRDRQTDGRTPDRYIDPAPHTLYKSLFIKKNGSNTAVQA